MCVGIVQYVDAATQQNFGYPSTPTLQNVFMNRPLLAAALLAAFTTALHIFGGTPEVEAPLLQSGMPTRVNLMLLACWHLVTAALALSAIVLGLAHRTPTTQSMAQVRLVSYLWLSFGATFIGIDLVYGGPLMVLMLPQWALFLSGGALGLWGFHREAESR